MGNEKEKFIARRVNCKEQKLIEHLRSTAEMAKEFCKNFDWSEFAYICGYLHDIGKYSKEFQNYIRTSSEEQKRGSVHHSIAGAKTILEHIVRNEKLGKIFAYVIAGHHTGLANGSPKDADDKRSLTWRLKNETIPDYSAFRNEVPPLKDITEDFCNWVKKFCSGCEKSDKRIAFSISFFVRMLFSCVVDADRLDAEQFVSPEKAALRKYPSLAELDKRLDKYIEKLESQSPESEVNKIRRAVREKCIRSSSRDPGFYSLTVPTGGGKTLSSMAFALKHAIKHKMDRIIYVIPYTSIIEQNADEFRKAFGEQLQEAVIEHHSNFDIEKIKESEEMEKWELSVENWDAPIIVTTNVQFFESLFSAKPSACRKLHNIANSVVILDEAQMLPPRLLYPILRALEELVNKYHTTVVLCTATQPALEKRSEFDGISKEVKEIIGPKEDVENLYTQLKRVNLKYIPNKLTDEELSERLVNEKTVLCVVNTRPRARQIFEKVKAKLPNCVFHLSANMCPAHRLEVLKEVQKRLESKTPCILVSTQLVEAGVNIDFPTTYRELAGIDSITQTAGRCNREGKLNLEGKLGTIYIFEHEDGVPRVFIQQANTTKEVKVKYDDDSLLSPDAVKHFFELYFWIKGENLDAEKILKSLSAELRTLDFPFRDISEKFKLIEDEKEIAIAIPWGKGEKIINEIKKKEHIDKNDIRRLQRFSVSICTENFVRLANAGAVDYIIPSEKLFPYLCNPSVYSEEYGIDPENPGYRKPENNII